MYVMSCCQYLRCSTLLQHTSSGFIKPAAREQLHRLCCDLRQLTRLLLTVLQKATSLDNACVRGHSGNLKIWVSRYKDLLMTYSWPSYLTRMTFLTFTYSQILPLATLTYQSSFLVLNCGLSPQLSMKQLSTCMSSTYIKVCNTTLITFVFSLYIYIYIYFQLRHKNSTMSDIQQECSETIEVIMKTKIKHN